jgi:hypothetical protein
MIIFLDDRGNIDDTGRIEALPHCPQILPNPYCVGEKPGGYQYVWGDRFSEISLEQDSLYSTIFLSKV